MPSSTESSQILIIGAGLGGLTLAQALRKRNIPFILFERDDGDHSRVQGWAVALHENLPILRENLPGDLGSLEQTSVSIHRPDLHASMTVFRTNGDVKFASGNLSDGDPAYMIRSNRVLLRNYLAQHLGVQWNKQFMRYEETDNGVTAFFKDGTSYRGAILVGADGSHSHVKRQLLGAEHSKLYTLPLANIIGEVTLDREAYERQLKIATSLYIVDDELSRFFVGLRDIAPNKESATYYWICGCPDPSFSTDPEHHWTRHADKEVLLKHAIERVKAYPPFLRAIVEQTKSEGIVVPAIVLADFVPPKALPGGRITLLGDAVHAMSPFKGQGANQAMLDGVKIAQAMEKTKAEGSDIVTALRNYEGEMIPRTTELVLASRNAAARAMPDGDFLKAKEDVIA